MQACHKDKMRFNILDGKSSVVWPSSLLPGLESKWWEEKGDLFAMLRMLFSPHPFHFLLSSLPQFLQHFFLFYCLIISSLSSSFASSLSTYHPIFVLLCHLHLLLPLTQLHLILSRSVSIPRCQSETKKITSISFTWHFWLLQYTIHRSFQVTNSALKIDFYFTYCKWIDEVVLNKSILHLCNEAY